MAIKKTHAENRGTERIPGKLSCRYGKHCIEPPHIFCPTLHFKGLKPTVVSTGKNKILGGKSTNSYIFFFSFHFVYYGFS